MKSKVINNKIKLKAGDRVLIIAGKFRTREDIIKKILKNKNRAILENNCKLKKHVKPTKGKPDGGVKEIEGSIHISNLMYLSKKAKATKKEASRIKYGYDKDGAKQRFSVKNKEVIK